MCVTFHLFTTSAELTQYNNNNNNKRLRINYRLGYKYLRTIRV